jgi:hypothetical protein
MRARRPKYYGVNKEPDCVEWRARAVFLRQELRQLMTQMELEAWQKERFPQGFENETFQTITLAFQVKLEELVSASYKKGTSHKTKPHFKELQKKS